MSTCIRCWGCTCNGSCTCTPQEIRQYKLDHWFKINPETWTVDVKSMWKEIWDLNPDDYLHLTKDDAIALFFRQTGKVAISQVELRKLLSFTKMYDNDSN